MKSISVVSNTRVIATAGSAKISIACLPLPKALWYLSQTKKERFYEMHKIWKKYLFLVAYSNNFFGN
jgi:hypothetical protein